MEAVLIALTIAGILVLCSTWGAWLVFPKRRARFEASVWFAFAPLVFGLIGLLATTIVVLVENSDTVSPALASNGTVILFNLYNGYRSVEAYLKQHRRH
jgi:hypothetical protein